MVRRSIAFRYRSFVAALVIVLASPSLAATFGAASYEIVTAANTTHIGQSGMRESLTVPDPNVTWAWAPNAAGDLEVTVRHVRSTDAEGVSQGMDGNIRLELKIDVNAAVGEPWRIAVLSSIAASVTTKEENERIASAVIGQRVNQFYYTCSPASVDCGSMNQLVSLNRTSRKTGWNRFRNEQFALVQGTGPETLSLTLRYLVKASSKGSEGSLRMGLSGTLPNVEADDYPGIGNRPIDKDRHTVTVRILDDVDRVCAGGSDTCPEYDPGAWVDADLSDDDYDNCYSYAIDRPRTGPNGGARDPGVIAGLSKPQDGLTLTCDEVIEGAEADGLVFIPSDPDTLLEQIVGQCEAQNACTVYAVSRKHCWEPICQKGLSWRYDWNCDESKENQRSGCDYHWYRRDLGGVWSHKPGKANVRRVDARGRLIDDPRNAAHHWYDRSCGFFCVPCELEGDGAIPAGPQQASSAAAFAGPSLRVVKAMHAGVDDPEGLITDSAHLADIESRLTGLNETINPGWEDHLGYRGLLLFASDLPTFPGGAGGFVRIRDGVVAVFDGTSTTYYEDGTGLEADLLGGFDDNELVPAMTLPTTWVLLAGLLGVAAFVLRARTATSQRD